MVASSNSQNRSAGLPGYSTGAASSGRGDSVTGATGAPPREPGAALIEYQSRVPSAYSSADSTSSPSLVRADTANAYSCRCGFQAGPADAGSTRAPSYQVI